MWDSENERIGLKKCSSVASNLRGIAELGGFLGLLFLFATVLYLIYKGLVGDFSIKLLCLLLCPFILGIACELIFRIAYIIADKKKYNFDPATGITTWISNGKKQSYSDKIE